MEVARELAAQVAKNPPLGVRSTVRARRHALEHLSRDVLLQVSLAKLHLSEDFGESARAFAEKRSAGPFKGR
jgi:enoyl-CoA hydratase/carnithine racemase